MIIVNINGGLGNQMFQFACGQAIGATTGEPVYYVTDTYAHQDPHNGFELNRAFGIVPQMARTADLRSMLGRLQAHPIARRALMKFRTPQWLQKPNCVFEDSLSYDERLASKVCAGGYLHGYWQSERYFSAIADQLRAAFSFRDVDSVSLYDRSDINVSLHVRRGDYINTGSVYASCDAEYYERALTKLNLPSNKTAVFIFSDDPGWASKELAGLHDNIRVISEHTGAESYKDMFLMSQCDHHVIANSSFSWWGAWLNPSSSKRVIAPKRWFADSSFTDTDIVPTSWERL